MLRNISNSFSLIEQMIISQAYIPLCLLLCLFILCFAFILCEKYFSLWVSFWLSGLGNFISPYVKLRLKQDDLIFHSLLKL